MTNDIKLIEWKNNKLRILDQSKLPEKVELRDLKNFKEVVSAIKTMKIKGAYNIGVASAFALIFACKGIHAKDSREFLFRLNPFKEELLQSFVTLKSISFYVERIIAVAHENRHLSLAEIRGIMLNEANNILEEAGEARKKISKYSLSVIKPSSRILVYGNTPDVIVAANSTGKLKKVFISAMSPMFGGAKFGYYFYKKENIPFTIVTDNMTGALMRQKEIDLVLAIADRITANGDVVSWIGTYSLALLCKDHGIPFYVIAPASNIDLNADSGELVPIDELPAERFSSIVGKNVKLQDNEVLRKIYDITPRQYITAMITEEGIVKPPYRENLKSLLRRKSNEN